MGLENIEFNGDVDLQLEIGFAEKRVEDAWR